MKNEIFLKLADKYEKLDKKGKPYIPMNKVKKLASEIIFYNDYFYSDSLLDMQLFNFKNKLKAFQIFNSEFESKKYLRYF